MSTYMCMNIEMEINPFFLSLNCLLLKFFDKTIFNLIVLLRDVMLSFIKLFSNFLVAIVYLSQFYMVWIQSNANRLISHDTLTLEVCC